MSLFACRYDGETEIALVEATCLEHAEDRWRASRGKKPSLSALVDVRAVPFRRGVARVSQLEKLFTPLVTR